MTVRILVGDCREVMQTLEANSVDAIVTDPPYGLEFMGKEWDRLGATVEAVEPDSIAAFGGSSPFGGGGQSIRYGKSASSMQTWHQSWAVEALRVLKPGGHMVAFGGTRTHHRLMCAIEDAGFEIRDCLMWLYGSGFPKSLDVGKAMDRQRGDYDAKCRVALWLRPHVERIGFDVVSRAFGFADETMARARWTTTSQPAVPRWDQWTQLKELCGFGDEMDAEVWRMNGEKGKPGENWYKREVLGETKRGAQTESTGRYGAWGDGITPTAPATDLARQWDGWHTALKPSYEPIVLARKPLIGSVAANVTQYGTGGINVDGCRVEGLAGDGRWGKGVEDASHIAFYPGNDTSSAASPIRPNALGRWPANTILGCACDGETHEPSCSVAMLDAQSGERKSGGQGHNGPAQGKSYNGGFHNRVPGNIADTGGASRFFYTAKASRAERNKGLEGMPERITDDGRSVPIDNAYLRGETKRQNHHPTVKPLDLMQWLVRLITPPGGVVLDPFGGSGSTLVAADREGFNGIYIDMDEEYAAIARKRVYGDAPMFAEVETI